LSYANSFYTNAESVRATIESILKSLGAKLNDVYRVSKEISGYSVTWTVELITKQRGNVETLCTRLLTIQSSSAPNFSFEEAWVKLYATELLPLAKRIAQILLLTHNIRCTSVCTLNYVDHYSNKCVTEHVLGRNWVNF